MSVSAEAQDCLDSVEASVGDLVPVFSTEKPRIEMAKS